MSFNIMDWKDDLRDELIEEIKNERILDDDDIQEFIYQEIDTACIYNSDCIEIIENLNAYDFSRYDLECTNIAQVAYCALLEETYGFDFDELKNEIDDD